MWTEHILFSAETVRIHESVSDATRNASSARQRGEQHCIFGAIPRACSQSLCRTSVPQIIDRPSDPATEVMPPVSMSQQKPVAPQVIPPRTETGRPPRTRRSWGWVVAVILVIAALAAVAILGTLLLTRDTTPKVSQEDKVRSTIQNFDVAIQKGDLATLRSITCGTTRDSYVNYEERAWTDTHARVASAKQYPVVADIDQVVVDGDHAEANVTAFMAYAPQTRSTRSFDLQYRDDQWKICESSTG